MNKYAIDNERIGEILESGILKAEDKNLIEEKVTEVDELFEHKVSEVKEEREKQYETYREKIDSLAPALIGTKYNFQISKKEYLYMKKLILNGLEYNRENLFIGIVVRDSFFYHYDNSTDVKKTSIDFEERDGKQLVTFGIDINEATRISHLLNLHTIKDLTSTDTENFSSIVKKLADITQIYNYYTIIFEKISKAGDQWNMGFEPYDNDEMGINEEIVAEKID